MWEKIRARFVDEATYWYKQWSSWMAIIWGGIVYAVWDDPSSVGQLLSALPADIRSAHFGAIAAVLAAALPIIVRNLKQGSLKQKGGQ